MFRIFLHPYTSTSINVCLNKKISLFLEVYLKLAKFKLGAGTSIIRYFRLAVMRAHISDVPIIPSKLLQISDRSLASQSSFEGMIGTDIHACFMASLLVMLEVGASLFFFSNQILQRKGRGNRHGYGWL